MVNNLGKENAVAAFLHSVYDAVLPFNCVSCISTFGAFIEAVGQCGPGMKSSTYHEVSVSYLTNEVDEKKL